jgi:DNA-binding PucR family transcriptional regulator
MPGWLETRLADEMHERASAYADLVLERIDGEVPELLSDGSRRALGRAGTEALLREFAGALRHELGDVRFHAPAAALAYGQYLAREGVPLASILRSYRLGQEVLFARAAELTEHDPEPEERVRSLARVGALSFRFSDGAMSDVATEYEAQRELFIRGTLAQRSATLQNLLAGRTVDVAAAERTLSHRLDGSHLAIVAWSTDTTAEAESVAGAARELVRVLGQGRPLVLTDTPGEATIWVTPSGAQARADALLPSGVHAAVGRPGSGVDGFVATKRQADLARSVASARADGSVTFYEDAALAALLLRDPDAARAFAAEELGDLARDTGTAAQLRHTLSTYFTSGHDQRRTAHLLGVHRNTVAKRLRRAEAVLDRPLHRRSRELEAALAISEVLSDREPGR